MLNSQHIYQSESFQNVHINRIHLLHLCPEECCKSVVGILLFHLLADFEILIITTNDSLVVMRIEKMLVGSSYCRYDLMLTTARGMTVYQASCTTGFNSLHQLLRLDQQSLKNKFPPQEAKQTFRGSIATLPTLKCNDLK